MRLNKCRQPTHALDSTQVNSESPTVQVCKERKSQTYNYALIIQILMYNILCLHSDQILVFCRCVHAEYNNNSALKTPYRPCSGCAELCLLGIMILTLRKGIES